MLKTTEVQDVTRRAHLVTFLAALAACLAAVLWMAAPYLLSLLLGGTLAMLAFPMYEWLQRRRLGPRLAAGALTGLLLLLVIAPLTGFTITAVKQGISISRDLGEIKEFSPKALTRALSRWQLVSVLLGGPAEVTARLTGAIQDAGKFATSAVVRLGKGIPEFLLQLVLGMIAFFFFLLNGLQFMEWLLGLGIFDRSMQGQLVKAFRDATISAVAGGFAAAASQAVLIFAGFLVLGIPGAFLAGGLTFIFSWIPVLGTVPALLAGMLYLYVAGTPLSMALLGVIGALAAIVDNLVQPLVMKGKSGMHPLVGLVAIISGIQMFGIMGVFVGPILVAMLLSLFRIWPLIRGVLGIKA
jgi:predicted PurR-regulated permease PerM